ncbi:hypothetical protein RM717_23130 [Streptomyces griseus]|uniref:Uncharacterized protein n=3 Tax=Streptomycetaceae TaxID=2062 RepID=A0ABU2W6B2_9ACTN|nr:hypothetical protein [Streptomyces griseus]ARF73977.1 hypothetical protein B7C62_18235 [Kitasatospora albolonga]MDT0493399.1 hypothetical protein [Streptomyces griseus]
MSVTTSIASASPLDDPARSWTCFVIGPIGDRLAEAGSKERKAYENAVRIFEKVILPACTRSGIVPVRADRIAHAGELTEQICRHVLESDFVIADVSGGNANVMYELGLRHVTGKPTIHIGEHGQLPFDISLIRMIRFDRSSSGLIDAREELENALESGIRDGFDLLTPARILRGLRTPWPTADTTDDEATAGDPDSPGLFERFAALEDQMGAMNETMEAITATLEAVASAVEAAGADMEHASRPGTPFSARLPVMAKLAASITEPASDLKEHTTRFAGQMAEMDATVHAAFDFYASVPEKDRGTEEKAFLTQMISTSQDTQELAEAIESFKAPLKLMTGASRHFRGPGRDISAALKQFSGAMARIEQWESRARSIA